MDIKNLGRFSAQVNVDDFLPASEEEKAYMVQPAKAVAPAAAAPALSALVGVWNPLAALIVLIAGEIACIRLGTKFMRK